MNTIKAVRIFLVLLVAVLGVSVIGSTAQAASTDVEVYFAAKSTTAPADGSSTITFVVAAYRTECANGDPPVKNGLCADGSAAQRIDLPDVEFSIFTYSVGDTFGGVYYRSDVSGAPWIRTDSTGRATFTVAASNAGSKTFTVNHYNPDNPEYPDSASVTVTFTDPAQSKTKKTVPPGPSAPEAPKAALLEVNGKQVQKDAAITIEEGDQFIIKGTTLANGAVILYIFLTQQVVTVTADMNGDWQYTVPRLEPGQHRIEVEVTDPKTGKTSQRAMLVAFTVQKSTAAIKSSSKRGYIKWWVGAAIVLIGGILGWFVWQRRQKGVSAASGQSSQERRRHKKVSKAKDADPRDHPS